MSTVLITGGTGLIGSELSKMLAEKGYDVIILTRNTTPAAGLLPNDKRISFAAWDVDAQQIDRNAIGKADYIIHLAGAGVAEKRWTNKRKKEIVESRTKSSELLVKALHEIPNEVKTVVSASAIGWYSPAGGEPGEVPKTENDPPDPGFLGETCRLWEAGIDPVTGMGKRLVKLRTGVVLSNNGGAFPEFKKPIRFGIAAILGSGKQIVNWIHITDLCRIYVQAMTQESWSGAYNAIAPYPVTNKTLTVELAKRMKGKFFSRLYVPSFLLKMIMGEMNIEVLKSAHISPEKIRQTGFQFLYPTLEAAFRELVPKDR